MGIINSQNPNDKTYSRIGDKLDWGYYDTLVLAAAGTEFSMFQVGIGGLNAAGAVKVISDTNLPASGQIPNGQNFHVRAIRCEFISHAAKATADINTFYTWLSTATLRIFVPGKDAMFSTHITEILGIPLLLNVTPTAAGDNLLIMSQGRYTGVRPLNVPLVLEEQTSIEVRINTPAVAGAALVGDFLRVYLLGVLVRAS